MCDICDPKISDATIQKKATNLERRALTVTVQCLAEMLRADREEDYQEIARLARESAHIAKGVMHFRETLRRREPPTFIIIDLNDQIKIER